MAKQLFKTGEELILHKEDEFTQMDGLELNEKYTVTQHFKSGNIRVSPSTLGLLHNSSSFKQKKKKRCHAKRIAHAAAFIVCLVLSKFVR